MDAVGVLWRSRLRRRWRAWVAIAVLLGLGAGTGMAGLAGARRTASSFDRIADAVEYPDIVSGHGMEPAEAEEVIGGFEGVADHSTQVGFTGFVEGLDPALIKYFIGSWDGPLTHGRPVLRDGRYPRPDRADEVVVSGRGVDAAGLEPGDQLTMRFFLSDFSDMVSENFVVTGTGADALEVAADAGGDRSAIHFTPAFTQANASRLQAWSSTRFVTGPGKVADRDLTSQILSVGWGVDESRGAAQARVQNAIRPLVVASSLLGALVLVVTMVLVGQALAREAEAGRHDGRTARAVGFTGGQVDLVDLLTALAVGVSGALVAVATAVALSPLFPVGTVRRLEPARGFAADLTVLGAGAVVLVLVLVTANRLRPHRSPGAQGTAARPLFAKAVGPAMSSGLSLATGGTTVQRRRFWAMVIFTATALTLVVAGIAFVGALARLSDDPSRYGVGWELTTRNAYGDIAPDQLRALITGDHDIEGTSGASVSPMLLDGVTVPALAILPITAELWPTLSEGHVPRSDDEVLVGADVLDALDVEVGDHVGLESPYSPPGEPGREVEIVGTAVFPSVEVAGIDPTRLGQGLAMTWDRYQSLQVQDPLPDIIFFDLAEGVDPGTIIDRYPSGMPEITGVGPTEWLPYLAPAEVLETERASPLVWTVIALLGLTVLATIASSLAAGVHRRRGDYAVLKTLGFTRRQVVSSVTWQSTSTMALALLIALPAGTGLGRATWQAYARFVGVIDTPVMPVLALVVVALGALIAAGVVSAGPGLLAARTRPAAVVVER